MSDIIIRKGEPLPTLLRTYGKLYIEELQLSYQMYHDTLRLHLLDDAMAAGKNCAEYSIHAKHGDGSDILNAVRAKIGDFTIPKLKAYLQSLEFKSDRYGNMSQDFDEEGKLTVYLSYRSSNRMYSPFALGRLKPLKEVPLKWTLSYVKRALANGQFKDLKCNGRYSDDYAYDNAVDYGRGPVSALPMLEKLVESPSGWWTSLDQKTRRVSICCHTFDSNSFVLELNPAPATEADVLDLKKVDSVLAETAS